MSSADFWPGDAFGESTLGQAEASSDHRKASRRRTGAGFFHANRQSRLGEACCRHSGEVGQSRMTCAPSLIFNPPQVYAGPKSPRLAPRLESTLPFRFLNHAGMFMVEEYRKEALLLPSMHKPGRAARKPSLALVFLCPFLCPSRKVSDRFSPFPTDTSIVRKVLSITGLQGKRGLFGPPSFCLFTDLGSSGLLRRGSNPLSRILNSVSPFPSFPARKVRRVFARL